jgi:hypothetical protein
MKSPSDGLHGKRIEYSLFYQYWPYYATQVFNKEAELQAWAVVHKQVQALVLTEIWVTMPASSFQPIMNFNKQRPIA